MMKVMQQLAIDTTLSIPAHIQCGRSAFNLGFGGYALASASTCFAFNIAHPNVSSVLVVSTECLSMNSKLGVDDNSLFRQGTNAQRKVNRNGDGDGHAMEIYAICPPTTTPTETTATSVTTTTTKTTKALKSCYCTPGSPCLKINCSCPSGYQQLSKGLCENINECQSDDGRERLLVCGKQRVCVDLEGSFACFSCPNVIHDGNDYKNCIDSFDYGPISTAVAPLRTTNATHPAFSEDMVVTASIVSLSMVFAMAMMCVYTSIKRRKQHQLHKSVEDLASSPEYSQIPHDHQSKRKSRRSSFDEHYPPKYTHIRLNDNENNDIPPPPPPRRETERQRDRQRDTLHDEPFTFTVGKTKNVTPTKDKSQMSKVNDFVLVVDTPEYEIVDDVSKPFTFTVGKTKNVVDNPGYEMAIGGPQLPIPPQHVRDMPEYVLGTTTGWVNVSGMVARERQRQIDRQTEIDRQIETDRQTATDGRTDTDKAHTHTDTLTARPPSRMDGEDKLGHLVCGKPQDGRETKK